ncbi:MAG: efflux RND transporter periplasmic adaptor subunit [Anaerolineae bacterium]|nr:efflux RND transporter periplasmic adaptor subunit [Anaerolineae bacterium]
MEAKNKRKRIYWIIGIVVILAAIGAFFYFRNQQAQLTQAAENEQETVTAFIGDLSASATASGTVSPRHEAALSVDMPGLVEAVHVRVGDHVNEGDTLIELDPNALAINLAIAEQNLKLKEASLADLIEEPTAAEIASANAVLQSAQAQLDDLLAGPSAEEIAAQEANLRAADANVWSVSSQLNQAQNAIKPADIAAAEAGVAAAEANLKSVELQYTRNPSPDDFTANAALAQAREQVASAQAALDSLLAGPDSNQVGSVQASLSASNAQRDAAAANFNKLNAGATAAQIAGAEAQLAQAKASLDSLLAGATDAQISAAEAGVTQAKISVADAQAALDGMTIKAPFAGVITAVNVSEGEFASGPVVEIVDDNSLEVILEVDEVDVGSLQVGQPATINMETWPDVEIASEIVTIIPSAKTQPGSSLVIYEVHLSLNETELPILVGMTANANLITAEKKDTLLVPNRAINADRSSGTFSVNLKIGDTIEEVPVILGLRDNQNTEIQDGIKAGDVLVVGNIAPRAQFGPPEE